MKIKLASVVVLLALGALSCSQPQQEAIVPVSAARQGGGSSTPVSTTTTTSTTTALPVLAPNPTPINDLGPIMPTGPWKVKTYYRAFADKTSDFSGSKFVFSSNGLVTATDSKGVSVSGSWYATIGGQVPYYGGAPSITALTMNFGKSAPKPFDRLSATWNVNLATTSKDVVLDNFEPLSGERIEFSL